MKQKQKQKQKQNKAGGNRYKANIWGTHAVQEAISNPQRRINALYVTEQVAKNLDSVIEPKIVEKHVIDRMLPQGAVHQGIAADVKPLPESFISDFVSKSKGQSRTLLLMLDQLTDPHNVGAVMRSACAFGVDGIIMQKKHAPSLTGVLAKTACGAVEHVPVAFETNLSRSIETLQENGFFVYGLDERGERNIGDADIPDKCVLVLGAEGPGIRRLVKEKCDMLLRLPMSGKMPSINVSNAAAVALYAVSSTCPSDKIG
jgi:23S rRNA (guanosine2251-2'-O)-methyltransferase